jgi:hypothetical protein
MSAVLTSPALMTSKVALAILLAMESRLREECKNYENKAMPDIPKMSEHHGGTQNHSGRVGTVGTHDV